MLDGMGVMGNGCHFGPGNSAIRETWEEVSSRSCKKLRSSLRSLF